MYDLHYDYMFLKYYYKFKLCYMDSFIYSVKTQDFYQDFDEDVEKKLIHENSHLRFK